MARLKNKVVLLSGGASGIGAESARLVVRERGKAVLADRDEARGRALAAELPLFARDGGFVAAGYSFELNQLRELRDDSRRAIAQLQARYAEASGVASLRIRHNNVIGYYVEVSAANAGKLGADFMHRQTMAGAMRYTTVELGDQQHEPARRGGDHDTEGEGHCGK